MSTTPATVVGLLAWVPSNMWALIRNVKKAHHCCALTESRMTEVILHSIEAMESNQWSWVGGDNPDYRGYRGGDAGRHSFAVTGVSRARSPTGHPVPVLRTCHANTVLEGKIQTKGALSLTEMVAIQEKMEAKQAVRVRAIDLQDGNV